MIQKFFLVPTIVMTITGCCAAYKDAVSTYAQTLPERGKIYYSKVTTDLKKELVLHDAALGCLVDKDEKKSTEEKLTSACKCSDGKPDAWELNCSEWLGSFQ